MNDARIPVVDDGTALAEGIGFYVDMIFPTQNGLENHISLKQKATDDSYIILTCFIEEVRGLLDKATESGEITSLDVPVDMSTMKEDINGTLFVKNEAAGNEPVVKNDVKTSILVVEDDEVLQQILCDLLELKKGYYVSAAGTGEEALTQAGNSCYDVALVDLTLPDIEGLELLRQLKKICPKTQCIILTGKTSEEIASNTVGDIAFAYLIKPSSAEEILNTVEKALGK